MVEYLDLQKFDYIFDMKIENQQINCQQIEAIRQLPSNSSYYNRFFDQDSNRSIPVQLGEVTPQYIFNFNQQTYIHQQKVNQNYHQQYTYQQQYNLKLQEDKMQCEENIIQSQIYSQEIEDTIIKQQYQSSYEQELPINTILYRLNKLFLVGQRTFKGIVNALGQQYDPDNLQQQILYYECQYCFAKYQKACALGGHISRTHPNEKKVKLLQIQNKKIKKPIKQRKSKLKQNIKNLKAQLNKGIQKQKVSITKKQTKIKNLKFKEKKQSNIQIQSYQQKSIKKQSPKIQYPTNMVEQEEIYFSE